LGRGSTPGESPRCAARRPGHRPGVKSSGASRALGDGGDDDLRCPPGQTTRCHVVARSHYHRLYLRRYFPRGFAYLISLELATLANRPGLPSSSSSPPPPPGPLGARNTPGRGLVGRSVHAAPVWCTVAGLPVVTDSRAGRGPPSMAGTKLPMPRRTTLTSRGVLLHRTVSSVRTHDQHTNHAA